MIFGPSFRSLRREFYQPMVYLFKKQFTKYSVVNPGNVTPQFPYKFLPKNISIPSYAKLSNHDPAMYVHIDIKNEEQIGKMRAAGKLARKILNGSGEMIKIGLKTQEIDDYVREMCFSHNAYPSTLNYRGFPKAVCTSVNNCVAHGIPDDRPLDDGDIINVDITVYLDGFHGDCSETFLVGNVDASGKKLVKVAKEAMEVGIKACGPGQSIHKIGEVIQNYTESQGFSVVPSFTGHGIGSYFHGPPDIYHVRNKYPGVMLPGMTFTVEPPITEGGFKVVILEDNWTAVTEDESRSAQFEHTILITENGIEKLTE